MKACSDCSIDIPDDRGDYCEDCGILFHCPSCGIPDDFRRVTRWRCFRTVYSIDATSGEVEEDASAEDALWVLTEELDEFVCGCGYEFDKSAFDPKKRIAAAMEDLDNLINE